MDKQQKINCTVESCAYQDAQTKRCTLQAINVVPVDDCESGKTDESMCGRYETND